ncbi:MAG: SDR family NAD(P)-dependent oxidoreductase, partial [Acidobacteriaceae bacterium]|nr:SDR family NAD(P)-dependent oxidoreductase [Acidobacteriaceae bacterium]
MTSRRDAAACFAPGLLAGRSALITGGGTGICRGIALAFASLGCNVGITSRRQEHLDLAVEELRALGVKAAGIAGDVRHPDEIDAVVSHIVSALGGIDILVNGAAGNFLCRADQLSPNGFGTVVDIDLKGTFNVSRAVYPHLKARGGVVLNISATLQLLGTAGQVHAAAAKAGIDAMTRVLAVEWGPSNVRVNGLAPGPVDDTEGTRRLLGGAARDSVNDSCPLGRL